MALNSRTSTQISGFLFENRFKVVGRLSGPCVVSRHSYLPFRADEHILGLNISYFLTFGVERCCRLDHRIHQVPEFHFFKVFPLNIATIDDLVTE